MIERKMTFSCENLEQLSVSELNTILRNELETDTPDREKVLLVLSILESRDAKESPKRIDGASEEWESTMSKHCGMLSVPVAKSNRTQRRWVKSVAIAAVITLVLLMTVPQALGAESIFKIIGQWTQELFMFSNSNNWDSVEQNEYVFKTEHEGLQQLYDAVVAQGITEPVVPTWIPDGFELIELKTAEQYISPKVFAQMTDDDQYIQIVVECSESTKDNLYPKDEDEVLEVEFCGVVHYFFHNDNSNNAIWIAGSTECALTSNLPSEELFRIIESIYVGGSN